MSLDLWIFAVRETATIIQVSIICFGRMFVLYVLRYYFIGLQSIYFIVIVFYLNTLLQYKFKCASNTSSISIYLFKKTTTEFIVVLISDPCDYFFPRCSLNVEHI